MKRFIKTLTVAAIILFLGFSGAFAIAGIGLGGGLDLLGKIKGVDNQLLSIPAIDAFMDTSSVPGLDSAYNTLAPKFYRQEIKTLYNFNGKLYIDALPFIDLEAGVNLSAKDYKFSAQYLDFTSIPNLATTGLTNDTIAQTVGFFRMAGDLTIRKTFLKFPPVVKLIRVYAGVGPSFVWCTPMVDQKMITDIMTSYVNTAISGGGSTGINPVEVGKKIVDQAQKSKMKVGGHLMFGLQIKPPVIPIGIYADGKLYFGLPTEGGTPGTGFVANAGITLGI